MTMLKTSSRKDGVNGTSPPTSHLACFITFASLSLNSGELIPAHHHAFSLPPRYTMMVTGKKRRRRERGEEERKNIGQRERRGKGREKRREKEKRQEKRRRRKRGEKRGEERGRLAIKLGRIITIIMLQMSTTQHHCRPTHPVTEFDRVWDMESLYLRTVIIPVFSSTRMEKLKESQYSAPHPLVHTYLPSQLHRYAFPPFCPSCFATFDSVPAFLPMQG